MYVRVVRFEDVDLERVNRLLGEVEQAEGPPEGVPASGIQILLDEAQKTAVVLQFFDTEENMQTGAKVFAAMDPSDTPGTRSSIDMCEMKLERRAE